MIAKSAKRGSRAAGLVYYLYGPGRANEHEDPHLVAAWSDWVPDPGRSDKMTIKQLAALLDQPVHALEAEGGKPWKKHVYHIPVSNEPGDPALTDAQWKEVATRIVEASGIVDPNDPGGCRWVAVRHADNHIHIVATLVRQDGRKPSIHGDAYRFRPVCNEFERRWGLTPTGPADRTAERRPQRAEQEKSVRRGLPTTPRESLRETVFTAAASVSNPADFFSVLRDAGVIVEPRLGADGQPTGYKVGMPEWRTKDGQLIWYSGGRLAPDLSLPKLQGRWSGSGAPVSSLSRVEVLDRAAEVSARAVEMVTRAAQNNAEETPAAVAAAADLLTANARALEGRRGGALTDAAEAFRRAAREPHHRPVGHDGMADSMRSLAHAISQSGRLLSLGDKDAGQRLACELVALVDAVAILREAQQARHQAEAALRAARHMRRHPDMPPPYDARTARAGTTRIMGRVVEVRAEASERADLVRAVQDVFGERADRVLQDPAWPALATTMTKVEETGRDPGTVFLESARSRELGSAESVAQVMVWRLENRLDEWAQETPQQSAGQPMSQSTDVTPRFQQPNRGRGRGLGPRT